MTDLASLNFDTMTAAEFEQYLPDLLAENGDGLSRDPRLAKFLVANPGWADLIRDLETIAATAKGLFEPVHEPSDAVWEKIAGKLNAEPPAED